MGKVIVKIKGSDNVDMQATFGRLKTELEEIASQLQGSLATETVGEEGKPGKLVFCNQFKPGNATVKEFRATLALLGSLAAGDVGGGGRQVNPHVNDVRDLWISIAREHPAWTQSPARIAMETAMRFYQSNPDQETPVDQTTVLRWSKTYNWESYLSLAPESLTDDVVEV